MMPCGHRRCVVALFVIAVAVSSCSGFGVSVSDEDPVVSGAAYVASGQVVKALQKAGVTSNSYWTEACEHAVNSQWDSARRAVAQAALTSGLGDGQKDQLQTMFTFAAGMPGLDAPVTRTFSFLAQALSMSREEMTVLARLASPGFSAQPEPQPQPETRYEPLPETQPATRYDPPHETSHDPQPRTQVAPAKPVVAPTPVPAAGSGECDAGERAMWLSLDGVGGLSFALPLSSPSYPLDPVPSFSLESLRNPSLGLPTLHSG